MHFLFNTEEENLEEFFLTIDDDDVADCCNQKIFYRGEEYYERGLIKNATYNSDKTSLKALVRGSEKYNVNIELQNDEVHGDCDCPYDDVCKHIVAVLLYAIMGEVDDSVVIEIQNDNVEKLVKDYLQTISKQQLVDLVLKFAPEQFFTTIGNKSQDDKTAKKIFDKVQRDIRNMFSDKELLYDIHDFDVSINSALLKLSGLETFLQKEIQNLVIEIIDKVGELTDEGYLYEHYEDECYEPSQPFFDFIENYVKSLTYPQKTDFFHELDQVLDKQGSDTFDQLIELAEVVYPEEELPLLKRTLLDKYSTQPISLTIKYYQKVNNLLNSEERKTILNYIKDTDRVWLQELAELYKSEGNIGEAITVTRNWLENNNNYYGDEQVHSLYLDLLAESGADIIDAAKVALVKCPGYDMIEKILSLTNENIAQFEIILMDKAPGEMLTYLEKCERLTEALNLVQTNNSIWDNDRNHFFRKYKKQFPEEAQSFFTEELNSNLEYTGDSYYYAIADAIKQLKSINPGLTREFLEDIRHNYKRRRNLMKILEGL